jgi:hypothetical protein
LPSRLNKGLRAFYEFVRRYHVPKHHFVNRRTGQLSRSVRFLPSELEAVAATGSEEHAAHLNRLKRMEELGRLHARGELSSVN